MNSAVHELTQQCLRINQLIQSALLDNLEQRLLPQISFKMFPSHCVSPMSMLWSNFFHDIANFAWHLSYTGTEQRQKTSLWGWCYYNNSYLKWLAYQAKYRVFKTKSVDAGLLYNKFRRNLLNLYVLVLISKSLLNFV